NDQRGEKKGQPLANVFSRDERNPETGARMDVDWQTQLQQRTQTTWEYCGHWKKLSILFTCLK
ncbi:MAG: hypothetical protein RR740_10300, partial [Pseudomonas sp.]